MASGLRPFARLRSATGRVYSMAAVFLAGITTSSDGQARQDEQPHKRLRRSKERVGIKPLKDFHNHPIYAGDLHRADMAWAKHAAGCGLTVEQIKDELLIAAISARRAAASANSNTPSGPPARLWSRCSYDDRLNKQGTCLNKAEGVEEANDDTDLP